MTKWSLVHSFMYCHDIQASEKGQKSIKKSLTHTFVHPHCSYAFLSKNAKMTKNKRKYKFNRLMHSSMSSHNKK